MAIKRIRGRDMTEDERPIDGEQEEEEGLSPHNILDRVVFGRRLRALRILEGYDRVQDFTQQLRSRFGVDVSPRSVYAIERGEQMPHLDLVLAAVAILNADPAYFFPAIRPDVVKAMLDRANQ